MRGRRPDVVSQEAKGNPGKRRKKPTIADRVAQLAAAPAAGPLSPPALLGLEEFAGAIGIWGEIAPVLERRNIIDERLDRHHLAMFCYYLDAFWAAVAQLAAEGKTQRVKTTAGGYMIRTHPAIRERDDAAKMVMDLSVRFGLTPLDRHKLVREIAGAGAPVGGLLGSERADPDQDTLPLPEAAGGDPDEITGFAGRNSGPRTAH